MTEIEKEKGIGKSKIGLVISGVLIVTLVISSLWLYTTVESLQRQVNALQTDKDNLQTQINNLETDNTNLQNQVNNLQSQIDSLNTTYQDYVATHSHSNSEYDNYVATHHYSDSEYNEAQFSFYYVKPDEQKFGVYDLDDELYGFEWCEQYEEGVFDCSEMSAYLEWYLENEGWHTKIVVGDSPFGSGRHAWLLVETSEGKYMPVEATSVTVVWWSDPNFDNYWIYDYKFETIQDAIAWNESEFDWWKSP